MNHSFVIFLTTSIFSSSVDENKKIKSSTKNIENKNIEIVTNISSPEITEIAIKKNSELRIV